MEIKSLSGFVWDYMASHDYCSRVIISGKFIDDFKIKREKGEEKKMQQRAIGRKIASMFTIMRGLGIVSKHTQRTVHVNREVFEAFSLQDVLKCRLSDFYKQ